MVRLSLPLRRPRYSLNRRRGSAPAPRSSSLWKVVTGRLMSRTSLMTLISGMMIGYLVVPMFIANQLIPNLSTFEDPQALNMNIRTSRSVSQETTEARIIQNQQLLSSQSVPTATTPYIIPTNKLADAHRKRIMVTGGAGFVGSHLVDKLMGIGHEVIVVDNFFTGQKKNIEHWLHHPNFR